ncbi:hypothetical protein TSH58p_17565 [Azospirillum sp. TSH58]|uniref:hypothetical protein n=1 Tax=Azospirillum sp. TSH58 TaxID=664962 RepID=UPI000D5FF7CF|nr:hypothetical protein [Azospirillum sp. TSH58]AWJ85172.1 hypothetical protein TSH58p_17565 [Azospirillum sp. TSH58]PWC80844.1 hypothetical protein TSH58_00965 [Azospirillum sp. TSH58]
MVLTNSTAVIPFELYVEPAHTSRERTKDFDVAYYTAWVESVGGWLSAMNWLNGELGTKYTRADVFRWGHPEQESGRPIPAKVRKLLTSQPDVE